MENIFNLYCFSCWGIAFIIYLRALRKNLLKGEEYKNSDDYVFYIIIAPIIPVGLVMLAITWLILGIGTALLLLGSEKCYVRYAYRTIKHYFKPTPLPNDSEYL